MTLINFIDFQEIHQVRTDRFGMVNLLIGQGTQTSGGAFTEINWDGTSKILVVELDVREGGNSFVQISTQPLTFVPYGLHRNIIGRGDLTVDGVATIGDKLIVGDDSQLNGDVDIAG